MQTRSRAVVWYSPTAALKVASLPDDRASRQNMSSYDWALGRRPVGTPQETSHVHVEPIRVDPDLYKMARLIRGDDR
jgi:hypothetical protein